MITTHFRGTAKNIELMLGGISIDAYHCRVNNSKLYIIPPECTPWPHEIRIAKILSSANIKCSFIPETSTAKTPNLTIGNRQYEIKSPISPKIDAVERNLKRATAKSRYIIFDSSRMRRLSDERIRNELIKQLNAQTLIKEIIFVDKAASIHRLTRNKK